MYDLTIPTIVNRIRRSVKVDTRFITRTDPAFARCSIGATGILACVCGRGINSHVTAWTPNGRIIAGCKQIYKWKRID